MSIGQQMQDKCDVPIDKGLNDLSVRRSFTSKLSSI